jgi:formylglycine-generating enzyme required for sulfatase activity
MSYLDGIDIDYFHVSMGTTVPAVSSDPFVAPPSSSNPSAPPASSIPAGMVFIQSGTFMMGSHTTETNRDSDETQHSVTISKGFYMGKYEVTQKEWVEVMGTNPSYWKGDNLPVEGVSWNDAIDYCNKRSVKEGLTPAYTVSGSTVAWNKSATGYRLPSEAEWEYACRAGTITAYNTGLSITTSQANCNYNIGKTTTVGSYAANAWGLYDMHGNVWELCWDWYGSYSSGVQTDPTGAVSGANRVLRGGSWYDFASDLRSANRGNNTPSISYNYRGFRLVRP